MNYKLYTLVDISHTGQHRHEAGKEHLWNKEQNFNTVLHTLGLRSNIYYELNPQVIEVVGQVVGFDTADIIRVWRFDWTTERDLYSVDSNPVGFLEQDFHLVPYISGLDEMMTQSHSVFSSRDPGKNIVFYVRN